MAVIFQLKWNGSQQGDICVRQLEGTISIGSADSNQIVLKHDRVSKKHVRIEARESCFYLIDLKSIDGTYINGALVKEQALFCNDRIRIGHIELIFEEIPLEELTDPLLKSKNETFQSSLRRLARSARSSYPLLLLGPSGAGKDCYARLAHQISSRRNEAFVSVNCCALNPQLIESELFGHLKGSFTGASADRKGAFETARGGTLFLDEIGDFPLELQPKLLRALENQEIYPVGSDRPIKIDARIICATHQNLTAKVTQKKFRADLYYRIDVLRIEIPALENRMEDFEFILSHLTRDQKLQFSFAAVQKLKEHNWPGNIRELKNFLAKAVTFFSEGQLEEEHIRTLFHLHLSTQLLNNLPTASHSIPFGTIRDLEKELILERLVANRGNQRQTALELGLAKSTLHDRIKSYAINTKFLKKMIPNEPPFLNASLAVPNKSTQ